MKTCFSFVNKIFVTLFDVYIIFILYSLTTAAYAPQIKHACWPVMSETFILPLVGF